VQLKWVLMDCLKSEKQQLGGHLFVLCGLCQYIVSVTVCRLSPVWKQYPRVVPTGAHISLAHDRSQSLSTNARQVEVLRNCVNFIFDNHISDAKKVWTIC